MMKMRLHVDLTGVEADGGGSNLYISKGQIAALFRDDSRMSAWSEVGPIEIQEDGTWSGLIAVEGAATTDGRFIAENALEWREPPLPVGVIDERGAEWGRQLVGKVERVWREDGQIFAEGSIYR